MKIKPRRAPVVEEASHPKDTTLEFEAGSRHRVHRQTTVTVERETVSFLIRRPVAGPETAPAAQLADGKRAPEMPEKTLQKTSPATRKELGENKA